MIADRDDQLRQEELRDKIWAEHVGRVVRPLLDTRALGSRCRRRACLGRGKATRCRIVLMATRASLRRPAARYRKPSVALYTARSVQSFNFARIAIISIVLSVSQSVTVAFISL